MKLNIIHQSRSLRVVLSIGAMMVLAEPAASQDRTWKSYPFEEVKECFKNKKITEIYIFPRVDCQDGREPFVLGDSLLAVLRKQDDVAQFIKFLTTDCETLEEWNGGIGSEYELVMIILADNPIMRFRMFRNTDIWTIVVEYDDLQKRRVFAGLKCGKEFGDFLNRKLVRLNKKK